jgi:hypothetical protein
MHNLSFGNIRGEAGSLEPCFGFGVRCFEGGNVGVEGLGRGVQFAVVDIHKEVSFSGLVGVREGGGLWSGSEAFEEFR